jgi:hypothetical protein
MPLRFKPVPVDPAICVKILANIVEQVHPDLDTPCWIWTRFINHDGYGVVWWRTTLYQLKRVSYTNFVGPIPEGMEIDHLCKVRACGQPAHLQPVLHLENFARSDNVSAFVARTGMCQRGHLMEGDNIKIQGNGHRVCRTCRNISKRDYSARNRATKKT